MSIILFFIGVASFYFDNLILLTTITTFINLLYIVKFRKNIPVLLLFVFFFLYTITFNYYFLDNLSISYWTDFQENATMKTTLFCHLLFIFFLGLFIKKRSQLILSLNYRDFFKPNKTIYFLLLTISILILIFGLQGQTLLSGGIYGDQETTSKSTLHEYFILIFFFLIVFSPINKLFRIINLFLLVTYVLKTLLFGSRIEVVEIALLWFYLFYVYQNRVNLKFLLFVFISGIYLITVVSNIRSNPIGFLSKNDLYSYFDPKSIFINKSNTEVISSNEGDVIQSSSRIIGLINKNELTIYQRISGFFMYLLSPVIPASFLPSYSNLSLFKQEYYKSGGGGLISVYFFAWLGYFGPIFIAIVLSFFINSFFNYKSVYNYIYTTFLFFTFPRWFAYNPIMLVKYCLYAVIFYFILSIINKNMIHKKSIFFKMK
jgi:hypothetical protein